MSDRRRFVFDKLVFLRLVALTFKFVMILLNFLSFIIIVTILLLEKILLLSIITTLVTYNFMYWGYWMNVKELSLSAIIVQIFLLIH